MAKKRQSSKKRRSKSRETSRKQRASARRDKPAPARRGGALTRLLPEIVSIAAVVVIVALVYHRAVQYFFSQDDFMSLWIAHGSPETFWRILSSYAYFGVTRSLFGLDPAAFHIISLLFHAASAVVVFYVARALSVGRGASLFGAVFFAVHPSLYVPGYAISSIGEILSCFFALLAAFYVLRARRPESAIAIVAVSLLFIASLLSKETTILFPLLVLPIYAARKMRLKRAIPLAATLLAIAVTYGALIYRENIFGIREGSPEAGAYGLTFGPQLATSLQTYFKWAFNLAQSWKEFPSNVLDPGAVPWLLVGTAIFILLNVLFPAHRRKTILCSLWFFLMLLPVLPLVEHPYHYYLYIPLAGFGPALGVLLAALVRSRRWEYVTSGVLIVAFALNSSLVVSRIENATVSDSQRRREAVFDRPIVAENLISDLAERRFPEGTKLLLISPLRDIRRGTAREHPYLVRGGAYWDSNLKAAISEDRGVRLFFPQVDTVVFAQELAPGHEDYTPLHYSWNGHLRAVEPARAWTDAGALRIQEDPSFAAICFRNALAHDSLYVDAHYYMARVSLSKAQFSQAADALRRFLELSGTDPRRAEAQRVLRGLETRGY